MGCGEESSDVEVACVFTGYARRRMAEREIPEEAVRHVLQNYDIRRPARPREAAAPAEIFIGDYAGRRLKVYVERGTNPPKVKTATWEG